MGSIDGVLAQLTTITSSFAILATFKVIRHSVFARTAHLYSPIQALILCLENWTVNPLILTRQTTVRVVHALPGCVQAATRKH